jgi:hypothetical protein
MGEFEQGQLYPFSLQLIRELVLLAREYAQMNKLQGEGYNREAVTESGEGNKRR